MTNYIFKTTTTMKEYNNKKWWIDSDCVPEMKIQAENLREALLEYKNRAYETGFVEISNNALKNKEPMYVDTQDEAKQIRYVITGKVDTQDEAKQIGYVITGKTEFEDRDNYKCSKQYIDLWVTILTVVDTDFD